MIDGRMPHPEIARRRLASQRLSSTTFTTPVEVVSWLGAVQAQEYPGAQWGLAQRMRQAAAAQVDAALASGAIVRTHILRPTWHFVAAADIRWMLALSGPRVSATMASYYRRHELEPAHFKRAQKALARALAGGHLTRDKLRVVIQRTGVPSEGVRFSFVLMQAELDGVICSGPRQGKQFTWALLDDRVPAGAARTRDAALAELTRRYFTSRGPATVRDFVWWSGLTTKDARNGIELAGGDLAEEVIDGARYWSAADPYPAPRRRGTAYLLPLYDEFLIAYKDRSAMVAPGDGKRIMDIGGFSAPLVIDGRVVASWKRPVGPGGVVVAVTPFVTLTPEQRRAIAAAVRRYGDFLGVDASLTYVISARSSRSTAPAAT
jgi:hypothetical protein